MSTQINISESILTQARDWYVRLADEQAGASEWEAFTSWLEKSPEHVDAYDYVELMLTDIPASAQNTETKSNVIQLVQKNQPTMPKPAKSYIRYAGIAAMLMAAFSLFATTNIYRSKPVYTQYATNIGEYENIVLSDGTKVNLNTNTQISVAMGKKTRTVTIDQGEAYFDLAPDEKRQFVVLAQGTTITDIGTAFSVYAADNKLIVAVAQGIVDMNTGLQVVRLKQGQKAEQQQGQSDVVVAPINIDNISTWRSGVLFFEDATLSSIVPELNRYFQKPIVLADEDIAAVTFSGVLNISNQDTLLGSMEALLPIKADTRNERIILSRKS